MESLTSDKFQNSSNSTALTGLRQERKKEPHPSLGKKWKLSCNKNGSSKYTNYNFWGNVSDGGTDQCTGGRTASYSGRGRMF